MMYLGDIAEDVIVQVYFTTNDASGAAVAPSSAFEAADVKIFKDGSATEKTATDGLTMTSPFNSTTGLHRLSIDTSDDTNDVGFWVTGSDYTVVLDPDETVDGQAVVAVVGEFSIENRSVVNTAVAVWDRVLNKADHNIAQSAGKRLRQLTSVVIANDDAEVSNSPAINQIQLASGESSVDGTFDPGIVGIVDGTGAGQCRLILEYEGSTRLATLNRDWKVAPDATSEYIIVGSEGGLHVNEGLARGGSAFTITLNALASSVDDVYNGQSVFLVSGPGQDQVGRVTDYVGSTKVATIETAANGWATGQEPTSATGYIMLPILGTNVTVTPLSSTVSAGDVSNNNVTAFQFADFSFIFTIVDSDGNAVPLAGKTLSFIIYTLGTQTVLFTLDTTSGDITISGDDDNQVTVVGTDTNTGTAGTFRYVMRNDTDDDVIARGAFDITQEPDTPA